MRILIFVIYVLVGFSIGWFSYAYLHKIAPEEAIKSPVEAIKKPYEKYSIENLRGLEITPGTFKLGKELADEKEYTSNVFSFDFNPEVEGETRKTTTGMINLPKAEGTFPLVIMFRGYVDQTRYTTGAGTQPAAVYFAKNGFITIAPDFLGYGGSDSEAGNIFETRLQTYTTAVSVLKSINQPSFVKAMEGKWDGENVFIWAHSNGGQIALTSLTITGVNYPTTLWAPASKPFPYVVLYYTDESGDGGKFIRRELAKFEELYDTDKYSYVNYIESIQAPIQLHQGGADNAVPVAWSRELVGKLKSKGKDITYFTYPGADHNLRPDWDIVVERDLEFFRKHQ